MSAFATGLVMHFSHASKCNTQSHYIAGYKTYNDVVLCDCQNCQMGEPYRDAQDRLL